MLIIFTTSNVAWQAAEVGIALSGNFPQDSNCTALIFHRRTMLRVGLQADDLASYMMLCYSSKLGQRRRLYVLRIMCVSVFNDGGKPFFHLHWRTFTIQPQFWWPQQTRKFHRLPFVAFLMPSVRITMTQKILLCLLSVLYEVAMNQSGIN